MLAALCGLAAAIVGGVALPAHGHAGIAAAIAISGWVGAPMLWLDLRSARMAAASTAARGAAAARGSLLATAVMGAVGRLWPLCSGTACSPARFGRAARAAGHPAVMPRGGGIAVYAAALQAAWGRLRLKDLATAAQAPWH